MLAQGMASKEIAPKMRMAKRTVDARIELMKDEYECHTLPQLVLKVFMCNILYFTGPESTEPPKGEKFYSAEQIGKMFEPELSKSAIIDLTKRGKLPGHLFGTRYYYRYTEVVDAGRNNLKLKIKADEEKDY